MKMHGFELPAALEADLASGRHVLSERQTARLAALLTCLNCEPLPKLCGLEWMESENRQDPQRLEALQCYRGNPSDLFFPGDIEIERSLVIGFAEHDGPISLDYRTQPPRVVYLGEHENMSYWVELAPDYEVFRELIGDP